MIRTRTLEAEKENLQRGEEERSRKGWSTEEERSRKGWSAEKKDLEKAEAQRKRDIEKVETQREKLKLDLEGKIERLERHANERDLEQKQADEATKRYIECIAENVDKWFLGCGRMSPLHSFLNFVSHIHFYPRTRRRWIKSSVETFLTVLKHLLRCSLVWAATPATHLLTLEMHLVFRRLSRNGNVSVRYLQRRKMKFRRRLLP